ncbi:MAG: DUF480 domain-containing protein [Planctomycetota bacterium]|nr:DUF480 domain-containing protein [Planctomycetota bacterium]
MSEELEQFPPITQLTKPQRRVLGVLIEKGFTTPEYYPMTLKAVTNACNQKSNRSPVSNYSEDVVFDTLEELRGLGLVGMLHTESGRTERFRHYMRRRFEFTEKQLAILTELMLRGRQQMGELRTRAARMSAIDGQTDLKSELRGLIDTGYAQTSGPVDRRGIDVDHDLYLPSESMKLSQSTAPAAPTPQAAVSRPAAPGPVATQAVATAPPASAGASAEITRRVQTLESEVSGLRDDNELLNEQITELNEKMVVLENRFDDLRRDLGG